MNNGDLILIVGASPDEDLLLEHQDQDLKVKQSIIGQVFKFEGHYGGRTAEGHTIKVEVDKEYYYFKDSEVQHVSVAP